MPRSRSVYDQCIHERMCLHLRGGKLPRRRDMWLELGIAGYMTDIVVESLFGKNDIKLIQREVNSVWFFQTMRLCYVLTRFSPPTFLSSHAAPPSYR